MLDFEEPEDFDKTAEEENCKSCKYSRMRLSSDDLWCRRYPPDRHDYFPLVEQDEWCGEYKNV